MNTGKRRTLTLAVITVVMALSLTFLAPSGAILPDAQQRYLEETLPDFSHADNAWDYKLDGAVGYLASAGLMDAIMPTNDIAYLPITLNEPGRVPIAENFTQDGYQDSTIIVEIKHVREYDSTFHVATVKIATPTQLRTAVSNSKYGDDPELFSAAMNAIVLMNGDFYTKTSSGNGYIVRQTEVYRWKASTKTDLLLIDENSDLHIIMHGDTKSVQEDAVEAFLAEHELINAFYFGPALVVDGVQVDIPKEYLGDPHEDNPRAAIGQLAPLTYVMVTVDGRTSESAGVTVEELASFMHSLGCTQAYAMDGGNSSILVFNHQMLSNKGSYETRSLSDVIFFASAIDN
ncbi:MAG TPA: phosphodiester glycosidase family protein [Candidatus Limiplasma sp.]|nr:phosphodiester glycosidase family protein [Candidatus Limiplasma sp.]